jgi:DNA polymerase-3 subunit alpha
MAKFTHLHVHSHYSLLDGLTKIDELLNCVKELGMDSVAITDHGNIYGAVEFYQKARAKGIKPIIGCEVYVAWEKMEQKQSNIDDKRYHLTLLVKNKEGYKNLVKLITKSHLEGFYYKPRIDEELLERHSAGLICLSGCPQGKIPKLILSKKIDEAEKIALKYQEIFGKDSFYLEIQHHPNVPEQKIVNQQLIAISKKYNIPLIATNDVHYLRESDAEAQDILMMINTGANPDDPERLTMKMDNFSMRSPEEMAELFKDTPEAIENSQKIVNLCNFEFNLNQINLPEFKTPGGEEINKYLEELCKQGLKNRYGEKPKKEILDRLNYELSIIKKTNFAPYFLMVQDFVNWAKQNRIIVGPGRGSASGSLVSYILGITALDPLKYELLFERFLNPERISPPDFDIDFTDRRRDEVIEYVSQKYGQDKVAQIITFGTMASRAVIRDVGRAMKYDYSYCDQVAKMIPFGLTLEQTLKRVAEFRSLYETDEKAKQLIDFAKKLEGVVRHASTHACGVVISKEPLDNIVPLQHPTQNEKTIVTQYEMRSIEALGLLKMDFLGLKNLTIIEDTLARIYKVQGKNINIETIPLNDKKTYKLLQEGKTTSVFQLESGGMQRYLKQLKPTEIEDIIAMVALYRPGPIQFIPDYIVGKHKKGQIKYLHPKLKPILEKTYGIAIYQEQIIKIAQEIAGFTYSEADVLRKAVGKKIKTLLSEQEEKFIKGVVNNGINKSIALQIWQWILPFAQYGFNRAHSAAYATIAYQTAYLKAHFPIEFMAAVLTSEKQDIERIALLIEECKKMKINVLPPDINESFIFFSVVPKENKIRFGLSAIKNVGDNVIEIIVQERKNNGPYLSIQNFISRINSRSLNKKSLESLIRVGVFDKMAERNQLLFNLERLLEHSKKLQKTRDNGQIGLFDAPEFNHNFNNNEIHLIAPAHSASEQEKLTWEKELLGLFISSHPLNNFKKILEQKTTPINQISKNSYGKKIRIGGIITKIKKIVTKNGKPMLFVSLEDLTDKIEVVVFPGIIETNPTALQENKIVFIQGKISNRDGTPKIICETIEEILEN